MLIDFIAGTKLDIYKIAPVLAAVQREQEAGKDIGYRFVYSGTKSEFLSDNAYQLPAPGIFLDITDTDGGLYTAGALIRYGRLLAATKPDITIIFGHSNGAAGCTLAAARVEGLKIAHIGSGMRTYNRNANDEINRRVIDSVTDYHFPIAQSSGENLRNEGVPDDFIFFIGNPISDYLHHHLHDISEPPVWSSLQLQVKRYILLNLEHAKVAGSPSRLKLLLLNIIRLSKGLAIILPVNSISGHALSTIGIKAPNLHIVNHQDTEAMYYLASRAKLVITDTQMLQEETTIMQVPCITLLKSEAVPDTHNTGYNEVTGLQPELLTEAMHKLFGGEWKKGRIPYLWDGKAAERIISVLKKLP